MYKKDIHPKDYYMEICDKLYKIICIDECTRYDLSPYIKVKQVIWSKCISSAQSVSRKVLSKW